MNISSITSALYIISSPSNYEVFKKSDSKSEDVAAAIHFCISSAHDVSFMGNKIH